MDSFAHVSCIILSAGSSGRMGRHKALLKFDGKITFIEKITTAYLRAGVARLVVVVSRELLHKLNESGIPLPDSVQLVINHTPESGRFSSLQKGVRQLKNDYKFCFFQNIDNPFTTAEVLQEVMSQKDSADVIIPAFQNKAGHPVLINSLVLNQVLNERDTAVRIDQFMKRFRIKKIETADERILVNVNSPEEYLKAGFNRLLL